MIAHQIGGFFRLKDIFLLLKMLYQFFSVNTLCRYGLDIYIWTLPKFRTWFLFEGEENVVAGFLLHNTLIYCFRL